MLNRLLAIAVCFSLFGLTGCNLCRELEEQKEALGIRLDNCKQQNARLESELQSARDQVASLSDQLAGARQDAQKYSQLSQKLQEAKQKLEKEKQAISNVVEDLEWLVSLEKRGGETVMVMENEILFPSGSHELTPKAKEGLDTLAQRLQDVPRATIRVDGHTDGQPIRATRDKYSSNWDLAAERAESVRAYLAEQGVSSERMYIAGFGPNVPRVPPATPTESVKENRRVEIVLMFDQADEVQELLENM